jgi:hypothetical protein
MMDVYLPIQDTLRPSVSTAALDEPWRLETGTQTVFWLTAPAAARIGGASSLGGPVSLFVITEHPASAGLERLRNFKGWPDNWDAEGAKAPCDSTIDFATKVFGLLSLHRTPEVTLDVAGNPMLLYNGAIQGEVIVTSDSTFDYFFESDDAPDGENIELSNGYLPRDLVSYISSAR